MKKPNSTHSTPGEIFIELKQHRSSPQHGALVILEGTTDRAFWKKFKTEKCMLLPANSKDSVMEALKIANENTFLKGVAAVIDPDCWLLEKSAKLKTCNLLFDDNTPDVELMLLMSQALENALCNTISSHLPEVVNRFAATLREESLKLAADFGYFRLLHRKRPRYCLRVKQVGKCLGKYIDTEALEIDHELVASKLVEPSRKITASELLEKVKQLRERNFSTQLELCRGKDTLSIMAHIIPQIVKRYFDDDYVLEEITSLFCIYAHDHKIARILRMNYDTSYFPKTQLYKRMRDWECKNIPFRILKAKI